MIRRLIWQENKGTTRKSEGIMLRFISESRKTEEGKPVRITVVWQLVKATAVTG
jgi:hypothetical protein